MDDYEHEGTANREEVATLLHGLADGVAAGRVRLGDDERTVDMPAAFDLELEFEADDGEQSLEVELEWPEDAVEGPADPEEATPEEVEPEEDESGGDEAEPEPVAEPADGLASRQMSLGRFDLFEDRGGEWRWRLVHRNGNVIATSGEGYTRKHNARKGLRSVMRNAEGAEVTERER